MDEMRAEFLKLEGQVKDLRHALEGVKAADTLPAQQLAQEAAVIGQDLIRWSVALKQAGRREADARALRRRVWTPPKMTAERAAEALRRRGACDL